MIEPEAGSVARGALLEVACMALRRAGADTLSSISVSIKRTNSPEETLQIDLLGAHLADQYGLKARVEVRERDIDVIFTRPRGCSADPTRFHAAQ